jgi:hypothetical protein
MTTKWIEPDAEGRCPACGEEVQECPGVEMSHATRWQPADYGCYSVECDAGADTIILLHTDANGYECSVGVDNTKEYCHACDQATSPEDYEDYEPEDYWGYEDGPQEPADWMVTESAW